MTDETIPEVVEPQAAELQVTEVTPAVVELPAVEVTDELQRAVHGGGSLNVR